VSTIMNIIMGMYRHERAAASRGASCVHSWKGTDLTSAQPLIYTIWAYILEHDVVFVYKHIHILFKNISPYRVYQWLCACQICTFPTVDTRRPPAGGCALVSVHSHNNIHNCGHMTPPVYHFHKSKFYRMAEMTTTKTIWDNVLRKNTREISISLILSLLGLVNIHSSRAIEIHKFSLV
jgi:hypothetical protein